MVIAAIGFLAAPSVASAKPMADLVEDGFKVGKLTQGKSGAAGWYLTKADQKYFCPAKLSSVYVDKKNMIGFTSSGRQVPMDRATFDAHIGGPDPTIPYWKDVQVGRVEPRFVGSCLPSK